MGCGKAEIWSLKKFKPSLSVKTLCVSHEADVRQTTDTIRTQRSRRRRFAQKQTIESVNMKYCVSDLSARGKPKRRERKSCSVLIDRSSVVCLSAIRLMLTLTRQCVCTNTECSITHLQKTLIYYRERVQNAG